MRMTLMSAVATAALAVSTAGCAVLGDTVNDLGKEGEAVHLTIGYQPYFTEAWSGLVMRGKEFGRTTCPRARPWTSRWACRRW